MTWLFRRVPVLLLAIVCVVTWMVITASAAPSPGLTLGGVLAPLAVIAGSAIGTFVVAVLLDDVAGILVAIKLKAFDVHKLGSFLESEFGTKRAIALGGLVVAAVTTAVGSVLLSGGLTQSALLAIADAAFAAATTGAAAMLLSVLADLFSKIGQLTGSPAPPLPAPKTP